MKRLLFFLCLLSSLTAHDTYKHVIFDLGQVLLDWNPKRMIEEAFDKEAEIPYALADVFSTRHWFDYDAGFHSRESLIATLPPEFDRALFARLEAQIPDLVPLIEGMAELVEEVKRQGCKVYMLSNMPREVFAGLDARHGLSMRFDGKVISSHVGSIKPAPSIYEALLNSYGLAPSECLFIDDREENILGGVRCGIDGIVFRNPEHLRVELKRIGVLPQ